MPRTVGSTRSDPGRMVSASADGIRGRTWACRWGVCKNQPSMFRIRISPTSTRASASPASDSSAGSSDQMRSSHAYATGLAAIVERMAARRHNSSLVWPLLAARGPLWVLMKALRLYSGAGSLRANQVAVVAPIWRIIRNDRESRSPTRSTDGPMRTRFHANRSFQATELLLQERTPREVEAAQPRAEEVKARPTFAN